MLLALHIPCLMLLDIAWKNDIGGYAELYGITPCLMVSLHNYFTVRGGDFYRLDSPYEKIKRGIRFMLYPLFLYRYSCKIIIALFILQFWYNGDIRG